MEQAPNLNVDAYKEYLDTKNAEYQNMLDTELETFKASLQEDQKNFFEQESKDFLEKMQGIKDSYFATYAESMKKADATPDEDIKERRKRQAEQRLDEFLDICNQQIKNFLQGFEN